MDESQHQSDLLRQTLIFLLSRLDTRRFVTNIIYGSKNNVRRALCLIHTLKTEIDGHIRAESTNVPRERKNFIYIFSLFCCSFQFCLLHFYSNNQPSPRQQSNGLSEVILLMVLQIRPKYFDSANCMALSI